MIQNKNKGFTLIELLVVIPKIRALKEQHLNVKISVDGGINSQNAKQILEAGADVLVIGSGIFNSKDVGGVIKEIRKVINKQ
jgi:ribulose-phosphate 3-epimerase